MPESPIDDVRKQVRKVELAIEDHAYDLEDGCETARKRMMKTVPMHVCGYPGYMIDESGEIYRVWGDGDLELLDEPAHVEKKPAANADSCDMGTVSMSSPVRPKNTRRSIRALMLQMQHPAAYRFIKIPKLRDSPEAKHDLLVMMYRDEPEPVPEESVRMVVKNLHRRKLWTPADYEAVHFPNHAVDCLGFVWRVTMPMSLGSAPNVNLKELPLDHMAETLPADGWQRVAIKPEENKYSATRFTVHLTAKTGDTKGRRVDVTKLVEAYHGFDEAQEAYRHLHAVYDPVGASPGTARSSRTMGGSRLRVGEKMAAKIAEIGDREDREIQREMQEERQDG